MSICTNFLVDLAIQDTILSLFIIVCFPPPQMQRINVKEGEGGRIKKKKKKKKKKKRDKMGERKKIQLVEEGGRIFFF